MKKLFGFIFFIFPISCFSIPCDCQLLFLPPLQGGLEQSLKLVKVFELEEYNRYSKINYKKCRSSCSKHFGSSFYGENLTQTLRDHSAQLISEGKLPFSCVGQTQLKFPIKLKAFLGDRNLGVVEDFIEVINYDKQCF